MTVAMKPRVPSLAPQFLVDDLERAMAYYRRLGFTFGEPWDSFYAIGRVDGLELHLKEAPKNEAGRRYRRDNEHLDAAAGVDGIEAFYEQCAASGITILKPLTTTAWGRKTSTSRIRMATSFASAAAPQGTCHEQSAQSCPAGFRAAIHRVYGTRRLFEHGQQSPLRDLSND